MGKGEDTGLGFTEFLAAPSAGVASPSPAGDAETGTQAPAQGDIATKTGTPSDDGETAPKTGAPATLAPAPTAAASGEKADSRTGMPAGGETQKPPAAPQTSAKEGDNGWQARAERAEKQYSDTRNWATQINQQLTESRKQLEIVSKKLDGTYDAEAEKVQSQPSPEEIARQAGLRERVRASSAVAEQMFGAEKVAALFADGAPFGKGGRLEFDPVAQQRVLSAELPTVEAFRFLEEETFFNQYGRDPAKIREKIRDEVKAEVQKDIDHLVDERIKERLKLKQDAPLSLGTARGSGEPEHTGLPKFTPLSQLGNPGLAA